MDPSIEEEARALRRGSMRKKRIWISVILGNALMLLLIVGGPYLRGRLRARAGRAAFAEFAACLVGGQARSRPGLSLPEDSLEHYVDRTRTPGWPSVCHAALSEIGPDHVFFVFPSVRHAESETRRALRVVRRELNDARAVRNAATPERPWLALQRLMAAMTLWAEAADISLDVFEEAIRFDNAASTVRPERIPLRATEDAALSMRMRADGVEVLAFDERGLSWSRIGGGTADTRRMRRPQLLRGGGVQPNPWLLWSTPDERCRPDCARMTTGFVVLTDQDSVLPEPVYFAAHPVPGPPSHIAQLQGETLTIAATAPGGVQLKRFKWPGSVPVRERDDGPTREAGNEQTNDDRVDEDDEDPPAPDGDERVAPIRAHFEGTVAALEQARLVGRPSRLVGIDAFGVYRDRAVVSEPGVRWFESAGTGVFLGRHDGTSWLMDGQQRSVPVTVDAASCQTAFTESAGAIASVYDGQLHGALCRAGQACEPFVIREVRHFALAFAGESLVLAYAAAEDAPIRVGLLDAELREWRPAACLSEHGGLCGRPALVAREGRIIVGSRDRHDMLAVESGGDGSWRRLRGLR